MRENSHRFTFRALLAAVCVLAVGLWPGVVRAGVVEDTLLPRILEQLRAQGKVIKSTSVETVQDEARVTVACANGEVWTYDGQGRPARMKDATGKTTRYQDGLEVEEQDAAGKELSRTEYVRDAAGRIRQSVKRGRAGVENRWYDTVGDVTQENDAQGTKALSGYVKDRAGRTLGYRELDLGTGQWTMVELDPVSGEVVSRRDATGGRTRITYTRDANGEVVGTTERSETGSVTEKRYEHGQLVSVTKDGVTTEIRNVVGENGNLVESEETTREMTSGGVHVETVDKRYDPAGWLAEATDETGKHEYRYEFTAGGSLSARRERTTGRGGTSESVTRYDEAGRVVAEEEKGKRTWTRYTLDENGNILSSVERTERQIGARVQTEEVRKTFDGQGRMLTSTDGMGKTTTYEYDAQGRQTGTRCGDAVTRDSYDEYQKLRASVTEDGTGTTFTYYGADGKLVERQVRVGRNGSEEVTRYGEAGDGERAAVTMGAFGIKWTEYQDAAGTQPKSVRYVKFNGKVIETEYEYAGENLVSSRERGPDGVTETQYGGGGKAESAVRTDRWGRSHQTSYIYADGKLASSETVDVKGRTETEYDADGNAVRVVRENTVGYPRRSEEQRVIENKLLVSGITRSARGVATTQYDVNGLATEVRLARQVGFPRETVTKNQYDAGGDLSGSRETDERGTTQDQFGADGLLKRSVRTDAYGYPRVKTTEYRYAGGELAESVETDEWGRMTAEVNADGLQVTSRREKAYGYPRQETTAYQYRADGTMSTSREQDMAGTTASEYTADELVTTTTRENQWGHARRQVTTYAYHGNGTLSATTEEDAKGTTQSRVDPDGLVRTSTRTERYGAGYGKNTETTNGYDGSGFLVTSQSRNGLGTTTLVYDRDGLVRRGEQTDVYGAEWGKRRELQGYAYDGAGRVQKSYEKDRLGETENDYDGDGDAVRRVRTTYLGPLDGRVTETATTYRAETGMMERSFSKNRLNETTVNYDENGLETAGGMSHGEHGSKVSQDNWTAAVWVDADTGLVSYRKTVSQLDGRSWSEVNYDRNGLEAPGGTSHVYWGAKVNQDNRTMEVVPDPNTGLVTYRRTVSEHDAQCWSDVNYDEDGLEAAGGTSHVYWGAKVNQGNLTTAVRVDPNTGLVTYRRTESLLNPSCWSEARYDANGFETGGGTSHVPWGARVNQDNRTDRTTVDPVTGVVTYRKTESVLDGRCWSEVNYDGNGFEAPGGTSHVYWGAQVNRDNRTDLATADPMTGVVTYRRTASLLNKACWSETVFDGNGFETSGGTSHVYWGALVNRDNQTDLATADPVTGVVTYRKTESLLNQGCWSEVKYNADGFETGGGTSHIYWGAKVNQDNRTEIATADPRTGVVTYRKTESMLDGRVWSDVNYDADGFETSGGTSHVYWGAKVNLENRTDTATADPRTGVVTYRKTESMLDGRVWSDVNYDANGFETGGGTSHVYWGAKVNQDNRTTKTIVDERTGVVKYRKSESLLAPEGTFGSLTRVGGSGGCWSETIYDDNGFETGGGTSHVYWGAKINRDNQTDNVTADPRTGVVTYRKTESQLDGRVWSDVNYDANGFETGGGTSHVYWGAKVNQDNRTDSATADPTTGVVTYRKTESVLDGRVWSDTNYDANGFETGGGTSHVYWGAKVNQDNRTDSAAADPKTGVVTHRKTESALDGRAWSEVNYDANGFETGGGTSHVYWGAQVNRDNQTDSATADPVTGVVTYRKTESLLNKGCWSETVYDANGFETKGGTSHIYWGALVNRDNQTDRATADPQTGVLTYRKTESFLNKDCWSETVYDANGFETKGGTSHVYWGALVNRDNQTDSTTADPMTGVVTYRKTESLLDSRCWSEVKFDANGFETDGGTSHVYWGAKVNQDNRTKKVSADPTTGVVTSRRTESILAPEESYNDGCWSETHYDANGFETGGGRSHVYWGALVNQDNQTDLATADPKTGVVTYRKTESRLDPRCWSDVKYDANGFETAGGTSHVHWGALVNRDNRTTGVSVNETTGLVMYRKTESMLDSRVWSDVNYDANGFETAGGTSHVHWGALANRNNRTAKASADETTGVVRYRKTEGLTSEQTLGARTSPEPNGCWSETVYDENGFETGGGMSHVYWGALVNRDNRTKTATADPTTGVVTLRRTESVLAPEGSYNDGCWSETHYDANGFETGGGRSHSYWGAKVNQDNKTDIAIAEPRTGVVTYRKTESVLDGRCWSEVYYDTDGLEAKVGTGADQRTRISGTSHVFWGAKVNQDNQTTDVAVDKTTGVVTHRKTESILDGRVWSDENYDANGFETSGGTSHVFWGAQVNRDNRTKAVVADAKTGVVTYRKTESMLAPQGSRGDGCWSEVYYNANGFEDKTGPKGIAGRSHMFWGPKVNQDNQTTDVDTNEYGVVTYRKTESVLAPSAGCTGAKGHELSLGGCWSEVVYDANGFETGGTSHVFWGPKVNRDNETELVETNEYGVVTKRKTHSMLDSRCGSEVHYDANGFETGGGTSHVFWGAKVNQDNRTVEADTNQYGLVTYRKTESVLVPSAGFTGEKGHELSTGGCWSEVVYDDVNGFEIGGTSHVFWGAKVTRDNETVLAETNEVGVVTHRKTQSMMDHRCNSEVYYDETGFEKAGGTSHVYWGALVNRDNRTQEVRTNDYGVVTYRYTESMLNPKCWSKTHYDDSGAETKSTEIASHTEYAVQGAQDTYTDGVTVNDYGVVTERKTHTQAGSSDVFYDQDGFETINGTSHSNTGPSYTRDQVTTGVDVDPVTGVVTSRTTNNVLPSGHASTITTITKYDQNGLETAGGETLTTKGPLLARQTFTDQVVTDPATGVVSYRATHNGCGMTQTYYDPATGRETSSEQWSYFAYSVSDPTKKDQTSHTRTVVTKWSDTTGAVLESLTIDEKGIRTLTEYYADGNLESTQTWPTETTTGPYAIAETDYTDSETDVVETGYLYRPGSAGGKDILSESCYTAELTKDPDTGFTLHRHYYSHPSGPWSDTEDAYYDPETGNIMAVSCNMTGNRQGGDFSGQGAALGLSLYSYTGALSVGENGSGSNLVLDGNETDLFNSMTDDQKKACFQSQQNNLAIMFIALSLEHPELKNDNGKLAQLLAGQCDNWQFLRDLGNGQYELDTVASHREDLTSSLCQLITQLKSTQSAFTLSTPGGHTGPDGSGREEYDNYVYSNSTAYELMEYYYLSIVDPQGVNAWETILKSDNVPANTPDFETFLANEWSKFAGAGDASYVNADIASSKSNLVNYISSVLAGNQIVGVALTGAGTSTMYNSDLLNWSASAASTVSNLVNGTVSAATVASSARALATSSGKRAAVAATTAVVVPTGKQAAAAPAAQATALRTSPLGAEAMVGKNTTASAIDLTVLQTAISKGKHLQPSDQGLQALLKSLAGLSGQQAVAALQNAFESVSKLAQAAGTAYQAMFGDGYQNSPLGRITALIQQGATLEPVRLALQGGVGVSQASRQAATLEKEFRGARSVSRDDQGNIVQAVDQDGTRHEFVIDESGRTETVTSPKGRVSVRHTDPNGRLLSETGAGVSRTYSYVVGTKGQVTETTVKERTKQGVSVLKYDEHGRLSSREANGVKTTFARSGEGKEQELKVTKTGADGRVQEQRTFRGGRLVEKRDADGTKTDYEYLTDGTGKVVATTLTITDPDQKQTILKYDASGRLVSALGKDAERFEKAGAEVLKDEALDQELEKKRLTEQELEGKRLQDNPQLLAPAGK